MLAQLAGKAYKRLASCGCPLPSLEEWRHEEVLAATGWTSSLTQARQQEYIAIYNRLGAYLGLQPLRDRTWSEKDKALHLLLDAMQKYEIGPEYLAAIVRDQIHLRDCDGSNVYRMLREYATTEHIRHLMYTINARGRAEARKLAAE